MREKILLGLIVFLTSLSAANASADLSVSKITSVGFEKNIERFEELEITINYTNAGPDVAEDVVLEDPYGNVYGMVWSLPEDCENMGSKIRCQLGSLASGESGEIKYSAEIAGGAPTGMTTTYANITAQTPDEVLFDNSAATRFNVLESSRQRYFYYSFSTTSQNFENRETVLDRMADNVRLNSAVNEKEDKEKEELGEKNTTQRTSSSSPENRNVFVTYIPPAFSATSETNSIYIAAPNPYPKALVGSGSSTITIAFFSLVSALIAFFLWRRKQNGILEK